MKINVGQQVGISMANKRANSGGRGAGKQRGSGQDTVSAEVELALQQVALARIGLAKVVVVVVGGVVSLYSAAPLVRAVAGQETVVNVNIAVSLVITAAIAFTVAGSAFLVKNAEAKRLADRNRQLERAIDKARTEKEVAEKALAAAKASLSSANDVRRAAEVAQKVAEGRLRLALDRYRADVTEPAGIPGLANGRATG